MIYDFILSPILIAAIKATFPPLIAHSSIVKPSPFPFPFINSQY